MDALVSFARWEMIILLGGLLLAVVYKLVTGGVDMSGLLTVKGGPEDQSFSSSRAQMLISTVVAGMYYLLQVIDNPSATSLPDVRPRWPWPSVLACVHLGAASGNQFPVLRHGRALRTGRRRLG